MLIYSCKIPRYVISCILCACCVRSGYLHIYTQPRPVAYLVSAQFRCCAPADSALVESTCSMYVGRSIFVTVRASLSSAGRTSANNSGHETMFTIAVCCLYMRPAALQEQSRRTLRLIHVPLYTGSKGHEHKPDV